MAFKANREKYRKARSGIQVRFTRAIKETFRVKLKELQRSTYNATKNFIKKKAKEEAGREQPPRRSAVGIGSQDEEDNVKEDKVKGDKAKEDKVKEDKVKEDKVKEDNVIEDIKDNQENNFQIRFGGEKDENGAAVTTTTPATPITMPALTTPAWTMSALTRPALTQMMPIWQLLQGNQPNGRHI